MYASVSELGALRRQIDRVSSGAATNMIAKATMTLSSASGTPVTMTMLFAPVSSVFNNNEGVDPPLSEEELLADANDIWDALATRTECYIDGVQVKGLEVESERKVGKAKLSFLRPVVRA